MLPPGTVLETALETGLLVRLASTTKLPGVSLLLLVPYGHGVFRGFYHSSWAHFDVADEGLS